MNHANRCEKSIVLPVNLQEGFHVRSWLLECPPKRGGLEGQSSGEFDHRLFSCLYYTLKSAIFKGFL